MVLNKEDSNYRQCALTVMDNIADPDINFDEKGISNYYYEYKRAEQEYVFIGEKGENKIHSLVEQIKNKGKGKRYISTVYPTTQTY